MRLLLDILYPANTLFKKTHVSTEYSTTVRFIDVCRSQSQCTQITHVIRIPVKIQSGGSAVQTERKLDDHHESGGCFNWSNL